MNSLIKIAWRSLWRNRRRTIITCTSVFLAIFLALFMRSMQIGQYDMMINSAIKEAGHIQILSKDYWEKKSINQAFQYSKGLKDSLSRVTNIKSVTPRLEVFALGSFGELTKGLFVQGLIPELEDKRKNLSDKIVKGEFLKSNDNGIVIAEGLANYFKLNVNDTLVLISQGYQGISAAEVFQVKGIIKFPIPKLNNLMVFMNIESCRNFVAPYQPGLTTSLLIDLKNPKNLEAEAKRINAILENKYDCRPWTKILTEIVQQIDSDNIGGIVMLAILYIVVGFGILGTILMMAMERKKEFAVMIAVGMKRWKLAIVVFFESLMIGLIGIVSGIILIIPILKYLYHNPIPLKDEMAEMMLEYNIEPVIPFSLDTFIFTNQSLTIFIITLLVALFPITFIFFFKILRAMRS